MVSVANGTFARPGVVRQGWYLVARSSHVRTRQVRTTELGARRLVIYRDVSGAVHVTDDRCPHLGSDLALARVTPEGLRCEFHGWCWGADGSCVDAPGNPGPLRRRLRSYAVEERWGFIWAWTGAEAAFPLPPVPEHLTRQIVLASHKLSAHPDVIFSNGFDLAHFGPSHGIDAHARARGRPLGDRASL